MQTKDGNTPEGTGGGAPGEELGDRTCPGGYGMEELREFRFRQEADQTGPEDADLIRHVAACALCADRMEDLSYFEEALHPGVYPLPAMRADVVFRDPHIEAIQQQVAAAIAGRIISLLNGKVGLAIAALDREYEKVFLSSSGLEQLHSHCETELRRMPTDQAVEAEDLITRLLVEKRNDASKLRLDEVAEDPEVALGFLYGVTKSARRSRGRRLWKREDNRVVIDFPAVINPAPQLEDTHV